MKKIKVLLYHADKWGGYLNIVLLYLKTYFDQNYPEYSNRVEWLIPIQGELTDEQLIAILDKEKPELFCSSHYLWNTEPLMAQLERIKQIIDPSIAFIAGGPSIDPHVDSEFLNTRRFIDYAVYAAGEQAFADIIISKLENRPLIKFNCSNLAWFDNAQIVTNFKYVPEPKLSPYLHCADMLETMFNEECKLKGRLVAIPYALTRGCPYACTFCDWNSGLSNKVSRRKNSYKDEIDLFQKIGIRHFFLSDANVGQYDEDVDMIAYFAKKNREEKVGFAVGGSYSKLKKENNLKIFKLLASGDLNGEHDNGANGFVPLSVQDINSTVLKNIDRPDVSWPTHLEMVQEVLAEYPQTVFKVQLILGLPGQSPITWRETLREVANNYLQYKIYPSELLSTSPAVLDKRYQEKFKFIYSTSERYGGTMFYRSKFPESCISFTKKDFVHMTILAAFYESMVMYRQSKLIQFDIESIVDLFLNSKTYTALENNLWNNWNDKDKFYFTINFSLNDALITAHDSSDTAGDWVYDSSFIEFVEAHIEQK